MTSLLIFSTSFSKAIADDVNSFTLSKKSMIEEAYNNSPTLERLKSAALSSSFNKNQYLENFQPQLEGDTNYFKTNQKQFIEFAPITTPVTNASLGVKKDFISGVRLGAYNRFNKQRVGSFGNNVVNSVAVEFSMDLYKNLFGKDSKSRLSYLEYEDEISQIQKSIDKEIFLINLSRIYYSIILTQEAINVSNKILEVYKKQEADARIRYRNGITDLSEVNRRASQVSSKRVDIFNLQNNKENLILNLKELLPTISDKEIKLADYDFEKEMKYFSHIVKDVRSQEKTPMHYTQYDEVISLIEKSYQKQKRFTNNYSDLDLELYSTYEHFGQDESVRQTFDETYKDAQDSYQVGVRLNVPLGKTKKNSKDLQLALQKAQFLAKKSENLAKIQARHTQSLRNLEILRQAKIYQNENSKNLQNILRISEKKYKQARIPIRDLIEDQEFYLQSLLGEIDIKMSIINQIHDYLAVFTNTSFSLSNG